MAWRLGCVFAEIALARASPPIVASARARARRRSVSIRMAAVFQKNRPRSHSQRVWVDASRAGFVKLRTFTRGLTCGVRMRHTPRPICDRREPRRGHHTVSWAISRDQIDAKSCIFSVFFRASFKRQKRISLDPHRATREWHAGCFLWDSRRACAVAKALRWRSDAWGTGPW
jgi:hypothetical protein